MHAQTHQAYQGSRPHPVVLGAIIAVHAVGLTALLLAKSGYVQNIPTILIAAPISIDEADPPPPPLPQPDTPQPKTQIDRPIPLVEAPADDTILTLKPIRIDPIPSGPGDGPFTTRTDPPPHVPVLTEPRVDPRFADALQPPYPPAMQRMGRDGRVSVRVLVGTDGRVKAVTLISSSDDTFFAATERQALRYWRFKPATRDGVAIESWRTMAVRFEMNS